MIQSKLQKGMAFIPYSYVIICICPPFALLFETGFTGDSFLYSLIIFSFFLFPYMAFHIARMYSKTIIDGNRITISCPAFFGYSRSYDISDFDGLCTFVQKTSEGEQIMTLGLIREHRVRTTIHMKFYENQDEIIATLNRLPDKGRHENEWETIALIFGIPYILGRFD